MSVNDYLRIEGLPVLDVKVRYVTAEDIRYFTDDSLRDMNETWVIQDKNGEPLGVLIPYNTFIKFQNEALGIRKGQVADATHSET